MTFRLCKKLPMHYHISPTQTHHSQIDGNSLIWPWYIEWLCRNYYLFFKPVCVCEFSRKHFSHLMMLDQRQWNVFNLMCKRKLCLSVLNMRGRYSEYFHDIVKFGKSFSAFRFSFIVHRCLTSMRQVNIRTQNLIELSESAWFFPQISSHNRFPVFFFFFK